MSSIPPKLTEYELRAWEHQYNFTDGHARHLPELQVASILKSLPNEQYMGHNQHQNELQFFSRFFSAAGQTRVELSSMVYCPSASVSIEVTANLLRLNHYRVALIEPTFDNIADILIRHAIQVVPVSEYLLCSVSDLDIYLKRIGGVQALFLVTPNNPTGFSLSKQQLLELFEYCRERDILLVTDFSFRFYDHALCSWSQYEYLETLSIPYLSIEDTGKTWPSLELKVSPLVASRQYLAQIRTIYHDLFICVPPPNLVLLNALMTAFPPFDPATGVLAVASHNRKHLHDALVDLPFDAVSRTTVPVEWIQIHAKVEDIDIEKQLSAHGIHVLPGRQFYWNSSANHKSHFRVALMRDELIFSSGMKLLRSVLQSEAWD